MNLSERIVKFTTQALLLSVIVIVPFIKTDSLYFPFVSGKAYLFRILIAIAFFFWVWLLVKYKQYRPDWKNILVIGIVLFFLAQIVASFFGVDPVYSLFSSIERADGVLQYGFWILYFFMLVSVFQKNRDWKIFFSVFISVTVLLAAYSWFNYESQTQLSGVFGNPAYFAAFLLFAIGFSLLIVERKFFTSRWLNYAFLAIAGFFVITLIFTQIRGVYIALAGGVFLFSLLSALFLRKENKKIAFAGGVVLLAGFISLGTLFAAKDTDFVQSTRLLYRITEVTEFWDSASIRERVLNWNIALKAFQERPVFGYGPENFGSAANKYYDYRIGKGEPWFDRAHNQPLDTLATGGIVVFSLYLFWMAAAGFLIFKIGKTKKMLSFLLASIFLAYFLQGFFLFDLLAVYLGLFPFLAFLIFSGKGKSASQKEFLKQNPASRSSTIKHSLILGLVAILSFFVIYSTVFVPYKANAAAIRFYAFTANGFFKQSKPFLKEAFAIESPYTTWEVRKRAGWQFGTVLEHQLSEETSAEKVKEIKEIYDFITPELEKFVEARPFDPQMYYVLGRIYRFGYEKLGYDDLGKAEAVFKKGFQYSDLRVEYVNEFAKVLLLQGKIEEAEQSIKDYTARVTFYEYFPYITLGHFYFVAEKYEQALEQYEQAIEVGYKFFEITPEYARYMYVAEEQGDYQKVLNMAQAHLERWGPDADTYFNIAVSYLNLGDKEPAKEFFSKAIALDSAYGKYQSFFIQ